MTTVSEARGQSFEDARMTLADVEAALEQGTVIFNSAGAHIPKLARASLAAVDATLLPNALNMYVTAPGKRTSAPPHTDKQDVVVIQTSGSKRWKVYSPPEPSMKPTADMVSLRVSPLFRFNAKFFPFFPPADIITLYSFSSLGERVTIICHTMPWKQI